MKGCAFMLYLRKKLGNKVVDGRGNCDRYFICNQIETFGVNYDYVISFEISKEDYYKIKEFEDNRYTSKSNVLKDSLELVKIILDRSEYSKCETNILDKPDEVFEMELKMIGNDEILDYLNNSLQDVLSVTTSEEKQKEIKEYLYDYYNHLLNSIKGLTKIDYDNKTAEVLFYDSESSTDLLVNDYYLTSLLLNGLLMSNGDELNIEVDRDILNNLLENVEESFFDYLKSIKK